MTVKELIEWLKDFHDQEATVAIVEHTSGRGWYDQGGNASLEDFNPDVHSEYTDLRGNEHITPDKPYYNKHSLVLGGYDL